MKMPTEYVGKIEPDAVFRHVGFDVYCRVIRVYSNGDVKTVACDMNGADALPLSELTYAGPYFRNRWRLRPW